MSSDSPSPPAPSIKGGCFCGAVRYRVTGPVLVSAQCHCDDCRKTMGATSVSWFTVNEVDFHWVNAEPSQFASSAPVVRTFCPNCGTSLTYQHGNRQGQIDITSGSLDKPEKIIPTKDIFCSEKLSWVPFHTQKQE